LYSKWYLDSQNQIKYDDTKRNEKNYSNNAFIGIWKSYDLNTTLECNWADYRVPNSSADFDIGENQFSPSEKYYENGWRSRAKMYTDGNARVIEMKNWWR